MHANKVIRPGRRLGQAGNWQGRRIGGKGDAVAGDGKSLFGHLRLDGAVLEHRLDHQFAARQISEVRRGLNVGQYGIRSVLVHAAAGNPLL